MILLLPAAVIGVWQVLLPSWQTVRLSLFSVPGWGRGQSRFLGLEAYLGPRDDWLVGFGALVGVAVFLVVSLVGLLVGALTARAHGATRLAVRAVLGVTMIIYAPIGIGLTLRTGLRGVPDAQALFWILCVAMLPITSALTAVVIAVRHPARTG